MSNLDKLEQGVSYLNYRGYYGVRGFTSNDVDAANNSWIGGNTGNNITSISDSLIFSTGIIKLTDTMVDCVILGNSSFGVKEFIYKKNNFSRLKKADIITNNFFSKQRSKADIENFSCNNIWIGDLIYDSYLK